MSSGIIISVGLALCLMQTGAEYTPFPEGECGGTFTDEVEGNISSPGYPDEKYPSQANCTYIVFAPPNNVIAYRSLFMDIEAPDDIMDSSCIYDYVTLYDGDDVVGIFCGQQRIYATATTSTEFKVEFTSDFTNQKKGFIIDWRVFNPVEREISLTCNFDDPIPLCNGWENTDEEYLWQFKRGTSPSSNTGPLVDHTTKSEGGRYAFIEATDADVGAKATLRSPAVLHDRSSDKRCLNFWYHMYGSGTGNLTVTLDQDSGETEIVRLEGEKGAKWVEVNQTFTLTGLFATVSFHAFAGYNYMSDIAIDDINITVGSCDGDDTDIGIGVMNIAGGSRPISGFGQGLQINNIVPTMCLESLIKSNCATTCDLTCEIYLNGSYGCPRTCTGQCACPLESPIFENGICVNASACPTPAPPVTTAIASDKKTISTVPLPTSSNVTLSRDDLEKKKEIHDVLVGDFIAALLLYLNSTGQN